MSVYTDTETRNFPSWEAFLSWKEAEEESTYTYYVQPKGASMSTTEESGVIILIIITYVGYMHC